MLGFFYRGTAVVVFFTYAKRELNVGKGGRGGAGGEREGRGREEGREKTVSGERKQEIHKKNKMRVRAKKTMQHHTSPLSECETNQRGGIFLYENCKKHHSIVFRFLWCTWL